MTRDMLRKILQCSCPNAEMSRGAKGLRRHRRRCPNAEMSRGAKDLWSRWRKQRKKRNAAYRLAVIVLLPLSIGLSVARKRKTGCCNFMTGMLGQLTIF